MGQLVVSDTIIQRLEALAARHNIPVETLLDQYLSFTENSTDQSHFAAVKAPDSNDLSGQLAASLPENQGRLVDLLLANATDLICLHNPDGLFVYVSPSCRAIGGYSPEELTGTSAYAYFHDEDLTQIQTSHGTSLTGQQVPGVTYRFRRKDGSYVWLETVTSPVLDEIGQVTWLVTVSRDITEHRHIEEELRQERDLLSRIMETSPSGINVVNHDGQIIFANLRSEEILGVSKEKITSRTYDALTWKHTDYEGNPWQDEQQPFVRVMKTKAPVSDVRHAIEWSDGRRVYLAINGAPILDEEGNVSKVVFTIEDYTQRKLQQDALEAALEREKLLNEMKSRFISMVSHEFRTPMAIIMTSTGILRLKSERLTTEEILSRLNKIEHQIHRLDQLISNVTFINRYDHAGHSVHLVPVDLYQFFDQLVDEIQMAYPASSQVKVSHPETHATAMLDLSLLEKIFVNLVSNAVKYSMPDGHVVCRYEIKDTALVVEVSDTGIGIPQADQVHMFEDFYRANNVGNIQGTGMGLAIVQRAVEALQGNIRFESSPDTGTRFTVTLPLTPLSEDEIN